MYCSHYAVMYGENTVEGRGQPICVEAHKMRTTRFLGTILPFALDSGLCSVCKQRSCDGLLQVSVARVLLCAMRFHSMDSLQCA